MNFDKELTLLSEQEVWGVNGVGQLYVLKKYGTKAAITDLCVLTGSSLCEDTDYNIDEDSLLKGRTSWFWTRSSNGSGDIRIVDRGVFKGSDHSVVRNGTVRPVLKSSVIFSQVSSNRLRGYNGTEEVEYGDYPQYAPHSDVQKKIGK